MKIKIILFVCVVIVAFVTYNLGLVAGIKKEQRNEFFYHKALLDNCSKSMGDQLREYTKARYYLFSRYVGDDVFLTESKDLGPVDSGGFYRCRGLFSSNRV